MRTFRSTSVRGFTLIELLTVIAIIGILAAIIIPTTGAVRTSAKKAQTKSLFSNWATAMTLFKQEYGYFPDITNGSNKVDSDKFARALTGRLLNGNAITGTAATDHYGNKKKLSFYSFADSDLNTAKTAIIDPFENTDFVVLYDRNGNGMIDGAGTTEATTTLPSVTPKDGSALTPPNETFPLRAPVIFYSAGKGSGTTDIVYSWK